MRKIKFITMNNLVIIIENRDISLLTEVVHFISLVAILFAIFVIVAKNPIISVLFLIGLFCSIALYLMVLGINFIGLAYLLVYVGAVSILFIFILMLINIRISELVNNNSNNIPLVFIVSVCFSLSIYRLVYNNLVTDNYLNDEDTVTHSTDYKANTLLVTSKYWDANLGETDHITSIGSVIYSNYSILLIVASITLLLAMVGAIVITIRKRY